MQKPVNNKRPELRVRYTPEEFAQLKKAFARTAYNQIGTYARIMTLGEPIQIIHRNASFDGFVEVIAGLRKELAAIRDRDGVWPEDRELMIEMHSKIQSAIDKIVDLCMQS